MRVRVTSEVPLRRRDVRRLRRSLSGMLGELLPGTAVELSAVLVGEEAIRRLNSRYLDRDEPTDVLAFPQLSAAELNALGGGGASIEPIGDIVICVPVAARQAAERGMTRFEELELLGAHGLLHLVGYDDTTEEGASAMAVAERRLLGRSIISGKSEE